jgi:hypothetical protein
MPNKHKNIAAKKRKIRTSFSLSALGSGPGGASNRSLRDFQFPFSTFCFTPAGTGVASPDSLKSGKVAMKDYVLKDKQEPASNEIVWGSACVPRADSGVAPEPLVEPFGLGDGFRRDAENGNRDGRAPHESGIATRRRRLYESDSINPVNRKTAVNKNFHHQFLHKASLPCRAVAQRRLVIPAEFALPRGRECCACLRRPRSRVLPRGETKTAAGRHRMWRTRQKHKAREHWLAVKHQI